MIEKEGRPSGISAREEINLAVRLARERTYQSPNPEVRLRYFIRKMLQVRNTGRNYMQATASFAESAYHIDSGIGSPDYHLETARKIAAKLGFSETDIGEIMTEADRLYRMHRRYKDPTDSTKHFLIGSLPDLEGTRQQKLKDFEASRRKQRIEHQKREFTALMGWTDAELTRMSNNRRIDFDEDPVYRNSDRDHKAKMRERTLNEEEYSKILIKSLEAQDRLCLKMQRGVDVNELAAYGEYCLKDQRLADSLGEKFGTWMDCVFALLRGETLSVSNLKTMGLDSNSILAKAQSVLNHYYIDRSEKERVSVRPASQEAKVRIKRGTDPHIFLADGGHRKTE